MNGNPVTAFSTSSISHSPASQDESHPETVSKADEDAGVENFENKPVAAGRFTALPSDEEMLSARLLIVDDEERNVRLLRRVLERGGYENIQFTSDSRDVGQMFEAFRPDAVLLDLRMPYKDGFDIMRELSTLIAPTTFVPIIILTADATPQAKQDALAAGASDFITKPFDTNEILLRVRNLLRTHFLNQNLETKVYERTRALEEAQFEILQRLAQAAEFHDDDTGQHTQRVAAIAASLAGVLHCTPQEIYLIHQAAPLHDVGKIGIPDHILLKPGKLTPEEFGAMKQHTVIGANLLSNGHSPVMRLAERIALTHHERWDGKGYPNGLCGEEIPREGRILAVVDVFDALTHERPYKKAWPVEDALVEIKRCVATQFDPAVVTAFLTLPHHELI